MEASGDALCTAGLCPPSHLLPVQGEPAQHACARTASGLWQSSLESTLKSSVCMQVIVRDNKDLDARFDRAALYMDLGEPKKARSCCLSSRQ